MSYFDFNNNIDKTKVKTIFELGSRDLMDAKKLINRFSEKNLLLTKGSDFHGSIRPFIKLGSQYSDEIVFQKLKNS